MRALRSRTTGSTTDLSSSSVSEPNKSKKSTRKGRHTRQIETDRSTLSLAKTQDFENNLYDPQKLSKNQENEDPNSEIIFSEPEPYKNKKSKRTKSSKNDTQSSANSESASSEPELEQPTKKSTRRNNLETNTAESEHQKPKKSTRTKIILNCPENSEEDFKKSYSENDLSQLNAQKSKKSRLTKVIAKCPKNDEVDAKNTKLDPEPRKSKKSKASKINFYEETENSEEPNLSVSKGARMSRSTKKHVSQSLKGSSPQSTTFDSSKSESKHGKNIFDETEQFMKLADSCGTKSIIDISSGQMMADLKSFETSNLSIEKSCIIINDSLEPSKPKNVTSEKKIKSNQRKDATFDKNGTFDMKNATFDKNATFEKISNTTFEKLDNKLNETRERRSARRDTYQVKNSSGKWSVEDISMTLKNKSVLEESNLNNTDIVILHKDRMALKTTNEDQSILDNSNTDRVILHQKIDTVINENSDDTPSKSRKKWVKFDSDPVIQSPILRKSMNPFSVSKNTSLCSSTPYPKMFSVTSANKPKSTNKTPRSIRKLGTMPNFAKIHKNAEDKMESINEYSERKKARAEKLLSGEKPQTPEIIHKTNAVKSSAELFGMKTKTSDVSMKKQLENSVFKASGNTKTPLKVPKTKRSITPLKSLEISAVKHFGLTAMPKIDVSMKKHTVESKKSPKSVRKIHKSKTPVQKQIDAKKFVSRLPQLKVNQTKTVKAPKEKSILKDQNVLKLDLGGVKISSNPVNSISSNLNNSKFGSILDKSHNKSKFIINKPKINFEIGKSNEPVQKVDENNKPKSVFSKGHLQAVANKTKAVEKLANRDNRRDQLKGVRTNRRFELLMKMRNNN